MGNNCNRSIIYACAVDILFKVVNRIITKLVLVIADERRGNTAP